MNRKTVLLMTAVVLLVLSGLDYQLSAWPTEFAATVGMASRYGNIDLQAQDFDREVCQQDCSEKYGGVVSRSDTARSRLYALCMQECDRRFWKQFDRGAKELERDK